MVLYKYLRKHGLRFLSSLKLKLTSPADVDDPFEMRPCVGSSDVTDEIMNRLVIREDRMKEFFPATGLHHRMNFPNRSHRVSSGVLKLHVNVAVCFRQPERVCNWPAMQ
jgi:hypothetical protein